MPITETNPAPYAPPSAVMGVVKRYRDRGLQTPFTKEVLQRAGVTSSLAARTLQALESLDLIDSSGEPSEAFEGLQRAPQDQFKELLASVVRSAYSDVFQFADPAKDEVSKVRDAFRVYEPRGQQSRMVTLFLGLCAEAGIISEMPKRPGRKPGIPQKKRSSGTGAGSKGGGKVKGSSGRPPKAIQATGLPEPIVGLLAALPTEGWSQDQRDRFLTTFEAVLDFCIPVVEPDDDSEEEGHDD